MPSLFAALPPWNRLLLSDSSLEKAAASTGASIAVENERKALRLRGRSRGVVDRDGGRQRRSRRKDLLSAAPFFASASISRARSLHRSRMHIMGHAPERFRDLNGDQNVPNP
mgnify:FL=1